MRWRRVFRRRLNTDNKLMDPADVALLRALHRVVRSLRAPRSSLWHGIFSGVVRRTRQSQAMANLQSQATSIELTAAFRAGGVAALALPALGALRHTIPKRDGAARDTAFAALRYLHLLDASLATLESDGAFHVVRRTSAVRYLVGQRLDHRTLGPCVVYGWDHSCRAEDPPTAQRLESWGGEAGIVDNRKAFVGIDRDVDNEQPFFRVQLREGRGHYCAQENLSAVPLAEAVRVPIRGTSFFFLRADRQTGCLVPREELAQRYPDDVALHARMAAEASVQ